MYVARLLAALLSYAWGGRRITYSRKYGVKWDYFFTKQQYVQNNLLT